jgi:integrase
MGLGELWGESKPGREITREDCRQVRDLFAALPSNASKRFRGKTLVEAAEHARGNNLAPMTPKTANQHLARLSTFLGWAAREEHIGRNPAVGLAVPEPEGDPRDARRPFSIGQLQAIFRAPLYTGCRDDGPGYAQAGPNVPRRGRFWLPLLCLFSGLRMGEACALRVDDVTTMDGVA